MDAPAALCLLVAMFHSCNLRDIETVTPCICTGMGGAILVMLTVTVSYTHLTLPTILLV